MSSATVTVRGRALVSGQPDEARITLKLSAIRNAREEALAHVAQESDELEHILDELQIPDEARHTTGLNVNEETEYDGTTRRYIHRGFAASNAITLKVREPSQLGRLVQEATRRLAPEISGPYWELALDNPAHADACAQAARDAKRKAEAYATALGVRLGPVQRVSDPDVSFATRGGFGYHEHIAPMSVDNQLIGPEIEVHAGNLDVASAVEVTFVLEPA